MGGRECEQIVKGNIDMIYRIALSHTKTPTDADDVVQQTFIKLLTKPVSFQEPVFEKDGNRELFEAIKELLSKCRTVVYLFYYEGYTTKEIAGIIHIKEATVRTRLVTARKMLKTKLKEAWNDEE